MIERIESVGHLEDLLSEPTAEVIEMLRRVDGDILLLGVGGKMGPTLARMARRASDAGGVERRVIGVARFTNPAVRAELELNGIETIRCDLLDERQIDDLPDVPNVISMAARKFGSSGQESLTWAMNVWQPALVCRKFAGSRIVAFSTGNVYPFTPPERGGSRETDLLAPVGEYAMSALGRERIFDYFGRQRGVRLAVLRLNYAHEMRYGVMVDLAQQVWANQPIDLAMGYFNAIWQGDANAMTLRALDVVASLPCVLNLAGPRTLSVRAVCEEFGRLLDRRVTFVGTESPTALLSNGSQGEQRLGRPRIDESQLIRWTADWIARGGETLGKPTHFATRDGKF